MAERGSEGAQFLNIMKQRGQQPRASMEEEKSFNCGLCSKAYTRKGNLKQSVQNVHERLDLFMQCNKKFALRKYRSGLLQKKSFQNVPTFVIKTYLRFYNVCEVTFTSQCSLKRHKRAVHEKVRDYKCFHCKIAFTTEDNLNRHIQAVHLKLRIYKCSICKGFSTKRYLDLHGQAIHLKLRPFKCCLCKEAFAQKSHMNRHIKLVHEKSDYS